MGNGDPSIHYCNAWVAVGLGFLSPPYREPWAVRILQYAATLQGAGGIGAPLGHFRFVGGSG